MPKSVSSAEAVQTEKELKEALEDRYVVEELLGSGGAGHAYRVVDRKTRVSRVAKVLRPSARRIKVLRREFANEATRLARLRHPNLVGVFEQSQREECPYFVMEYVAGENVEKAAVRLAKKNGGGQWTADVRAILLQLADVLDYLHSQEPTALLHLDIKPDNVYVTWDFRKRPVPVLLDFGVARYAQSPDEDPQKTLAVGTFPMWPQRYLKALHKHTSEGRTVFSIRRDQLNSDLDLHLLGRTTLTVLEAAERADAVPKARWDGQARERWRFLTELAASLLIDVKEHPAVATAWDLHCRVSRVDGVDDRTRRQFDEGFVRLYWNHCVRAYAAMLSAALEQCTARDIKKHLWDTDGKFLGWLTQQRRCEWLGELLERRAPYRRAFVQQRFGLMDDPGRKDEKLFEKLEGAAGGKQDDLKVLRRVVREVLGIRGDQSHEIVLDVPRKVGGLDGVLVLPEGQDSPLGAGPIYEGIRRNFDGWARKARVFVHPRYMEGRSVVETNRLVRSELHSAFLIAP